MRKSRTYVYVMMVLLASAFVLWGCPKKAEVTSAPEAQKEAAQKEESKAESVREAPVPEAPPVREEVREHATAAPTGLKPIYFDFDKSFIRSDAKAVMDANAKWLRSNPAVKIRIEGNCDERGTKEYNQALGQRRAAAAKKYLTDMGISAKRISLISYGKENQVCGEHAEECWQKNRRDDFMVGR